MTPEIGLKFLRVVLPCRRIFNCHRGHRIRVLFANIQPLTLKQHVSCILLPLLLAAELQNLIWDWHDSLLIFRIHSLGLMNSSMKDTVSFPVRCVMFDFFFVFFVFWAFQKFHRMFYEVLVPLNPWLATFKSGLLVSFEFHTSAWGLTWGHLEVKWKAIL
jgi:hypothetical protein